MTDEFDKFTTGAEIPISPWLRLRQLQYAHPDFRQVEMKVGTLRLQARIDNQDLSYKPQPRKSVP